MFTYYLLDRRKKFEPKLKLGILVGSADLRKCSCKCETKKWIYQVRTVTEINSHQLPLFLVYHVGLIILIENNLRAKGLILIFKIEND